MKCTTQAVNELRANGLINQVQNDMLVSMAAESACGHKH
jgi:hypothetical protein